LIPVGVSQTALKPGFPKRKFVSWSIFGKTGRVRESWSKRERRGEGKTDSVF
jgi:hypothetical protein